MKSLFLPIFYNNSLTLLGDNDPRTRAELGTGQVF